MLVHRIAAWLLVTSAVGLLLAPPEADACTNFLVTRGASADGATMITYAADSHTLYGELYYTPAANHAPGALRKIFDWDTGKYLGTIPQVAKTFSVVGNMNEHQVVIGETTYGGRKGLRDPKGGVDYGSLMYVALERARTAREAIRIMTGLVAAHGYYSVGESFSIADPKEVWIMDLIGKGPSEKGAVWVARRIPEGYVSAHANQARIRTFPRTDPTNTIYAKDVVSFARKKGFFKGADADFSFADAYAPATCRDLRIREARVWSFFHRIAPKLKLPLDYVQCVKGAKPMPLWIKPARKLSPRDLMASMRDHFEGTPFDLRKDVGAGPFELPYRWRPLVWKVDGKKYLNERAIATQQTGFSFVSQSRAWLPGPIGGVLWFSVDDAASTVYIPMYAGITKISHPYAVGTGSFDKFSWDSAFWVFNWVSNFAYTRYKDIIGDIGTVQTRLETQFESAQAELEKKALALFKQSPAKGRALLTDYSAKAGERVVARWKLLGQELLMKYLDGNVRNAKGKVTHPPYPLHWYRRILADKGAHFSATGPTKAPSIASAAKQQDPPKRAAPPTGHMGQAVQTAQEVPVASQSKAGCGCRSADPGHVPIPGLLLLIGLVIVAHRRRQRAH
jgi:dipeptidase